MPGSGNAQVPRPLLTLAPIKFQRHPECFRQCGQDDTRSIGTLKLERTLRH